MVHALRADGHDVGWILEVSPGATDEVVLELALIENQVLLTFDNHFGELAFRLGRLAILGIILLRPGLKSPDYFLRFARAVLAQGHSWEGQFTVAEEGRLRIVPLPTP